MNNQLRNSFIILTLWFTVAATMLHAQEPSSNADVKKIDRIVAIVDDGVITERELNEKISAIKEQLEKKGVELPPDDILTKQVLDRLINEKLQFQMATRAGIKVDDIQLDKAMERVAEQNKMDLPTFKKELINEGISYRKLREDIRTQIILSRLKDHEVDSRINVTESEIDTYLTQQANAPSNEEFEISHILIRVKEDSSPEEIKKQNNKAEQALAKLNNGEDFAKVSASFSDAPNALEGGSLGWKTNTQLPELFYNAVKELKAGSITPILRSANGFHILKLTDRHGGNVPSMGQQTHVRHILIKVTETVSEKDAQTKIEEIRNRVLNGEKFDELAKVFSDDGSAKLGGDLGWINPGDTVPSFEKAMDSLKLNEISPVIKTQFGFHILEVLERRTQDMSKEIARTKARQEIRARKSEEEFQDWIAQMRDNAFIEIHLEDQF
jgi:peptidyl-prolyl cis-trans isomerase SurA